MVGFPVVAGKGFEFTPEFGTVSVVRVCGI